MKTRVAGYAIFILMCTVAALVGYGVGSLLVYTLIIVTKGLNNAP